MITNVVSTVPAPVLKTESDVSTKSHSEILQIYNTEYQQKNNLIAINAFQASQNQNLVAQYNVIFQRFNEMDILKNEMETLKKSEKARDGIIKSLRDENETLSGRIEVVVKENLSLKEKLEKEILKRKKLQKDTHEKFEFLQVHVLKKKEHEEQYVDSDEN
jgi:hypothetical protein